MRHHGHMTVFDMSDPAFDTTGERVHHARAESWYVETTWGWAVLRHAEASAVLKDRRFAQGNAKWPEQNGIHSGLFRDWWQEVLLSLEGDDHARLRRLLMPAFRAKTIAAMRPQFQALASELIDGFAPRGQVEFISEFAEPYAARILCLLMGLPESDWRRLAHWADDLGRSFGISVAADLPVIEKALTELSDYLADVVRRREEEPGDDLISTLIQESGADGRLSRHELGVALAFLAFAGMETTRNQLGLALQTLLAHPDQWALLAERPELGANAVEEVMRVNPTVTWVTREALTDVDLFGLHIPRGGIVQVLSHSAGTDPNVFTEPEVDITVEKPPHLGFGAGVHHCLGHFVARTDMAVALPLLAQRMPDARPDGPGRWLPISGNTGALEFPIRFSPGH